MKRMAGLLLALLTAWFGVGPIGPASGTPIRGSIYTYDAASNTSESTFVTQVAGTVARASSNTSSAASTGDLSALQPAFVAADDGVSAATPVGRRGSPLDVPRGTNEPATIGGRSYRGHALDEMQSEGFTPSVVNDVIGNGQATVGSSGRVGYYSPANNITVITESDGKIVTVTSGAVKIR